MSQFDPAAASELEQRMERGYREPGDDFFCLRYQVWYGSQDCAIRTHYRTAPGCARCEQGRFNHRRHRDTLAQVRFRLPSVGA